MKNLALSTCLIMGMVVSASCLTIGTSAQNRLISFPIAIDGTVYNTKLVLDGNWHWLHEANNINNNCFPTDTWNPQICTDPKTCWDKCAIQGIEDYQWSGNYGVHVSGNSLTMDYVTRHQYGTNVGSRMYIFDGTFDKYVGFNMLGKEISFEADMSGAGCGLNGAVYFVEMPLDGGPNLSQGNPTTVGLGYCDAQCTDIKFINGKAAGIKGFYPTGACCAQFDIWEANNQATQMTAHVCKNPGLKQCNSDAECGTGAHRYEGNCDMDGADYSAYRLGKQKLFGAGSEFQVDTTKPMTVKTQFITDNGQQSGNLIQIKRYYVQNGKTVFGGSLTDKSITQQKQKFGENNYFEKLGGLKAMGQAFKRKMTLVLSFWDDSSPARMLWLDGVYPPGSTSEGSKRGPCPADSGNPERMRNQVPNSKVKYSNIQIQKLSKEKVDLRTE